MLRLKQMIQVALQGSFLKRITFEGNIMAQE